MKQRLAVGSLRGLLAVATIVVGFGLSAPASGEDMSDEFARAVDENYAQYSASINAGDADSWIELWDDGGVQMPPGTPAKVGKATILERRRAGSETYDYKDFVIKNEEVELLGDFGFARGTYSALLIPKAGGEEIPIDGKYLTIFKKQADGTWKIYRDAFNSNVPPK
jgi:uncharacterized protein (TIGR02246 family)